MAASGPSVVQHVSQPSSFLRSSIAQCPILHRADARYSTTNRNIRHYHHTTSTASRYTTNARQNLSQRMRLNDVWRAYSSHSSPPLIPTRHSPSPPNQAPTSTPHHITQQQLPQSSSTPIASTKNTPAARPFTTTKPDSFHATSPRQRDHHFDTLKFTQRLQSEGGLSEAQALSLMRVLSSVLSESMSGLTRTLVPREDAIKSSYTQKIDFNTLRSELNSIDSSESAVTRTAHERLGNDLQKLNQRLGDEVGRTRASVRLDLNLEKGRIREEMNAQELRIKETETRIEQEVAGLRERVEGVKFDTVRWLAGVTTGTAALLLGAWRLFM